MANHRNRFPGRRRFLKQSTALTATVVALPLPRLTGAQQPAPTEEKKTGDEARPAPSTVRAPAQRRRGHKQ
jgi:hypothetical protein